MQVFFETFFKITEITNDYAHTICFSALRLRSMRSRDCVLFATTMLEFDYTLKDLRLSTFKYSKIRFLILFEEVEYEFQNVSCNINSFWCRLLTL